MQHGVGLVIKEEIKFCYVCGSLRADRDRHRGGKVKYMSALNSTVASVPAREHVFVLMPMVEMCSTKMVNYCCVSQQTMNSLL